MSAAWAYEYVMTAKSTKITYHYENNTQDTHTHTHIVMANGDPGSRASRCFLFVLSLSDFCLTSFMFMIISIFGRKLLRKRLILHFAFPISWIDGCQRWMWEWRRKKNPTMIFVFQLIIITTIIIIFHIYSCLFNAMKWNGMPCLSVLLFWSF